MNEILSFQFTTTTGFVFISGPQGVGKTKICADLAASFRDQGKTAIVLSLDDFYLAFEEQVKVSKRGNPLLKYRGLPGTHDYALAMDTLTKLASGEAVLIPRYQKSLNQGRGDRLPIVKWESVSSPVDRVIFEGWCLGFKSLPVDYPIQDYGQYLAQDIMQVNLNFLELEKLYKFADVFVQFKAQDLGYIEEWRWEQELEMKREFGPDSGLTKAQVKDFVSRFMPIYHYYLSGLDSGFRTDRLKFSAQLIVGFDRKVSTTRFWYW